MTAAKVVVVVECTKNKKESKAGTKGIFNWRKVEGGWRGNGGIDSHSQEDWKMESGEKPQRKREKIKNKSINRKHNWKKRGGRELKLQLLGETTEERIFLL